jgi:plasmid stabilization system protein ParE
MLDTLKAPKAAADHFKLVEKAKAQLEDEPKRHRLVRNDYLASQGYRSVMVKKFYIFFIVDDDTKTVNLIRFLHSSRNWMSILREGE